MIVLLVVGTLQAPSAGAVHPKLVPYSTDPKDAKVSLKLLQAERSISTTNLTLRRFAEDSSVAVTSGGLLLDIVYLGDRNEASKDFAISGVTVYHHSERWHRVSASIDNIRIVHQLAAIPKVVMVKPQPRPELQSGIVTSQAFQALKTDIAQGRFHVDGSGQKIGILSGDFAHTSGVRDANTIPPIGVAGFLQGSRPQDTGDLPSIVEIRNDGYVGSAGDEGAAMAELVHDLAPGATLAFHTALLNEGVFADGIEDLWQNAGCSILVDDVIMPTEPIYQDGPVAQAASEAADNGVVYFCSAGNTANRGFWLLYNDLNPNVDDTDYPPTGADFHDWGGGIAFLVIQIQPLETLNAQLHWNQPSSSVAPGHVGSQIDMDLYLYDEFDQIAESVESQGDTGEPFGDAIESISYTNFNFFFSKTVYLAVEHYSGNQEFIPQSSTTRLEFRLIFSSQEWHGSIQYIPDETSLYGGPTIRGHALAPGVISVGAVPWYEAPTYNSGVLISPEPFSSRGGDLSYHFDGLGNFNPYTDFHPDIACVDKTNTTFFGGDIPEDPDLFPNFTGTSAAAPSAAAIAALMLQLNPSLSPDEIRYYLQLTAVDVTGYRAAVGPDDVTGWGLIDAEAALEAVAPDTAAYGSWTLYE
jgi:subtilisin family serine protease